MVQFFMNTIPHAFGVSVNAVESAFGKIPSLATRALHDLPNLLLNLFIKGPLEAVGFLAGAGTRMMIGLYQAVVRYAPTVYHFFTSTLPTTIIGALANAGIWLLQHGEDILKGLLHGVTTWAPRVWNFFTNTLPNTIINSLATAGIWLVQHGIELLHGLLNGSSQGASSLWAWLRGLPGSILSALGNLGSTLLQAGKDLINGFLNGAKSVWHTVTDWVNTAKNDIVNGFKTGFGLFSPSRVMHAMGVDVMLGFGNGLIAGYQSYVTDKVKSIVGDVTTAIAGVSPPWWTLRQGVPGGGPDIPGGPIVPPRQWWPGVPSPVSTQYPPGFMGGPITPVYGPGPAYPGGGAYLPGGGFIPRNQFEAPVGQQTGGSLVITINNPVPESSETSIHRTMQKIKFHGLLPLEAWQSRTVG
jgi:hypothetical protein